MHRTICTLAIATVATFTAAPQAMACTLNGKPLTMQERAFFDMLGLPHGDYFVRDNGDFGLNGKDPLFNVVKLVEAWERGEQPDIPGVNPGGPPVHGPDQSRQSRQQVSGGTGLEGLRVFWVYSPSIFSGATGGSSGYIHLCPGGVFYRSSEGSISVGGGYNSRYGMNDSWAGAAGTARASGRWGLDGGGNVVLTDNDGGRTEVPLTTIQQGRWTWGQTKYVAEPGKASCR